MILSDRKDGAEELPLLFNFPKMPREAIRKMIDWCDQTVDSLKVDVGRQHHIMRFCEARLKIFDQTPEMAEDLMERWEKSVTKS